MSGQSQSPPPNLEALASDVLELSKNYKPSAGFSSRESDLILKAKELIATAQSPIEHAMSLLLTSTNAGVIRTLMSLKVLHAIPLDDTIGLADLEKITGAQAALLERLLRVSVGYGFIRLNDDKTYSHTRTSAAYATTNIGTLFSVVLDEVCTINLLPEYFQQRGAREPDGEKATTHNPSTWRAGQEGKTMFEILEQDPEKVARFQQLMNMSAMFRPYTGFYNYNNLQTPDSSRTVLVDVGGGDGTTLAKILKEYTDLNPDQCILQDLPSSAELAKQNSDLPSGVKRQSHDFFSPQPVKHARAYQLRACLHDWSDFASVQILKQIVPVMAPDSKILIAENVMPETGAQGMASFMDLGMLCIGGKERTRANWEAVLDAADLKLDGIHQPADELNHFGMIEASLKST